MEAVYKERIVGDRERIVDATRGRQRLMDIDGVTEVLPANL